MRGSVPISLIFIKFKRCIFRKHRLKLYENFRREEQNKIARFAILFGVVNIFPARQVRLKFGSDVIGRSVRIASLVSGSYGAHIHHMEKQKTEAEIREEVV